MAVRVQTVDPGFVISPSEIRAHLQAVKQAFTGFRVDVQYAGACFPATYRQQWTILDAEFRKWYNQLNGWDLNFATFGAWETADQYAQMLEVLQTAYTQSCQRQVSVPVPTATPGTGIGLPNTPDFEKLGRGLLWVGGGILGLYAIASVISWAGLPARRKREDTA